MEKEENKRDRESLCGQQARRVAGPICPAKTDRTVALPSSLPDPILPDPDRIGRAPAPPLFPNSCSSRPSLVTPWTRQPPSNSLAGEPPPRHFLSSPPQPPCSLRRGCHAIADIAPQPPFSSFARALRLVTVAGLPAPRLHPPPRPRLFPLLASGARAHARRPVRGQNGQKVMPPGAGVICSLALTPLGQSFGRRYTREENHHENLGRVVGGNHQLINRETSIV